jgi:hypothetical protein
MIVLLNIHETEMAAVGGLVQEINVTVRFDGGNILGVACVLLCLAGICRVIYFWLRRLQ